MTSAGNKRSHWHRYERRCDMRQRLALRTKCGFYYASLFLVTPTGRTLSDIKADPDCVEPFARALCDYVENATGGNLPNGDWCICTTPRRRHRDSFHFASEVCASAASKLGIKFHRDIASAKTRCRIDTDFALVDDPAEHNIILFDDILTTGITMRETRSLLLGAGHTVLPVVAIRNGE